MEKEKQKLPAIQDLYGDVAMKNEHNKLNQLLNQEPHKTWIKSHPFVKGLKYIPIERIEWLLTRIFINWWVEVRQTQIMANSIALTIRLHYKDVLSGDWLQMEGVGAAPIQTNKDAGATDFTQIKASAVQIALPAAKSYAIKDAAECIGKLFGKDLNRSDKVGYDNLKNTFKDFELISQGQFNLIEGLLTTSTYEEPQKEQIEQEMSGYSIEEAAMCITVLKENQLDHVKETGNYSATDIKNHKIQDNE